MVTGKVVAEMAVVAGHFAHFVVWKGESQSQ